MAINTNKKSRRIVTQKIGNLEIHGKKIEDVINLFLHFHETHNIHDELTCIVNDWDRDEDGELMNPTISFSFKRLENDFEYSQRMEMIDFSKKREFETYQRLKKKFENE